MMPHDEKPLPANAQAQVPLPGLSGDDQNFCEEHDAWEWTQDTDGEPGEGSVEWGSQLHQMALRHPNAVATIVSKVEVV